MRTHRANMLSTQRHINSALPPVADAHKALFMRSQVQLVLLRAAGSLSRLALRLEGGAKHTAPSRVFERAAARAIDEASRSQRSRDAPHRPDLPVGLIAMYPRGQMPSPLGTALLLVDHSMDRFIPVFVGASEALAFKHRLEGTSAPRPLTHDLLDRVLDAMGAEVADVTIAELRGDVFIATVRLTLADPSKAQRSLELDARASDAIILALGRGLPVMVTQELLDTVARPLDRRLIAGLE